MLNPNSYYGIKYKPVVGHEYKELGKKTERGIFEIVCAMCFSFSFTFLPNRGSGFTCAKRPINPTKYRNYRSSANSLPVF